MDRHHEHAGEEQQTSNLTIINPRHILIAQLEDYLQAARRSGRKDEEAGALASLGSACFAMGDYLQATGYYERQLVLMRQMGNENGASKALDTLGDICYAQGDYQGATSYYHRQLSSAQESSNPQNEETALGNLRDVSFSQGDYQQTLEYHVQADEVREAVEDGEYPHISHDDEPSQTTHDPAHQGTDPFDNPVRATYTLGDTRRAIEHYERQRDVARNRGDSAGEANACWNIGVLCEQAGDMLRAAEMLQIAVAFYESVDYPGHEAMAARLEDVRRNV